MALGGKFDNQDFRMIRTPNTHDHLLLVAAVMMFSQSFVSLRIVVPEFGTLWTITFRVAVALAVLLPWAVWRGFEWPSGRRAWGLVFTLALLNVILPFGLFTWGLTIISAGEGALIFGAMPIFGLIVSHFSTHDDRFTVFKFAGVALGFVGIGTLFGFQALSGNIQTLTAYGAVLLSAMSYALSGGVIRKLHGFPPVRLTALIYLIALPFFIAAVMAFGPRLDTVPPVWVIANMIFLGLFPSGLGYIVRFVLIPQIGYSYFALFMNLIPVGGVMLGAIVLGETITTPMLAALVLILAGLAVARIRRGP